MNTDNTSSVSGPRELSRETRMKGDFIEFQRIIWLDAYGKERVWETVERVKGIYAVMMISWFRPSPTLLLIRQYRPPAGGLVLEFPAGLVDPGEAVEAAARRELREETGFIGAVTGMSPPTFNTPGLSGETVYQVYMDIDESRPENRNPEPDLDEGEHIEIVKLPRAEVGAFLEQETAAGTKFDSKVMTYLQGLEHGRAGEAVR